jgi:hypothetical protein
MRVGLRKKTHRRPKRIIIRGKRSPTGSANFGRLAKLANGHLWSSIGRDAQATHAIIYFRRQPASATLAGQFETEYKMLKRLFLASVMLLPIAQAANAAQFSYEYSNDRSFVLVFINGDIKSGDDDTFYNYTSNLAHRPALVVLNSDGGSVIAGLNMGLHIRRNGWNTSVRSGSNCTSICGMMWLAGTTRYAGRTANIGFHAAYDPDTGSPTAVGNALTGAYLHELGFSYDTIIWLVSAPPIRMEWLTAKKAEKYGIVAKTIQ